MPNILTQLRVDEISSVDRGAGDGVKIVLMKRDNTDDHQPLLFNDVMKAVVDADDDNEEGKLTAKLHEFASIMDIADPTRTHEEHLFNLINTAHGRSRAEHLNNLLKGETKPMTRSEEMQEMKKFVGESGMSAINKRILEKGSTSLTEFEHAELTKLDAAKRGISFEKAMDWAAYAIVRDQGHLSGYLTMLGH